jgi:phosphate transport system substrate-binding protein
MFGVINRQGEYVIYPYYDSIAEFRHGVAKIQFGDLYGLIHESGTTVLPVKYTDIMIYANPACTASTDTTTYDFALWDDQAVPYTVNTGSIDMDAYMPHTGSLTPSLDEPASLRLTDNLPRLDGATALFPLYSGLAQAVYPESVRFERTENVADPVVAFTNTPGSYYRLIHNQCDLIFVAQPSDEQLADAAEAGVELELTPIATEAFVFFVNGGNPLEGLTVEQIREIYSGKITRWDELGVSGIGDIIAYQRPKNSGSQTALEKLMGDVPLMAPPSEVRMNGFSMDAIVNIVEYRNTPDALGYSFRFFLTTMMDSNVNLLALNGVEPTEETIANGSYPIIAQIYAVTRKDESNPNVQAVLDWLRSEQGKELIRRSGYVPAP